MEMKETTMHSDGCAHEIRIRLIDDANSIIAQNKNVGDWIDLRSSEDVEMKAGEFKLIHLGVAMKLPDGYEAHLAPRSSTFKNFGIIQTNSVGVIDNSYSGDNDEWMFPALAIRDTKISKGDRICQFRIMLRQPDVCFRFVESLGSSDRGGFGSTGVK